MVYLAVSICSMKIGDLVRHNYGLSLSHVFEYGIVISTKQAGLRKEILMCEVWWFDAGSPGFYRSSDLELISECGE